MNKLSVIELEGQFIVVQGLTWFSQLRVQSSCWTQGWTKGSCTCCRELPQHRPRGAVVKVGKEPSGSDSHI